VINIKFKIKQKLVNYFGLNKTSLTSIRPSSYPFISGDTFRSISDYVIESKVDLKNFCHNGYNNPRIKIVFLSAGLISQLQEKNLLYSFQSFGSLDKVLVIHNGDYLPDDSFLIEIATIFSKVFCVNTQQLKNNIYPIPIGLENLHYIKNGITSNFFKYKNLDIQEKIKKKNLIFSSFNLDTNVSIRKRVFKDLNCSRFKLKNDFISHDEYLRKLSESFFCISPPGNGFDCHRTWEAIYLGAVPVVLKGFLAQEFIKSLPIIEVQSYEDFLSKSDKELLGMYTFVKDNKKSDMAYFYYWQNLISNCEINVN
jgi:hypothetical protein